ncbi:class I SAM-dependent methyltransferase [Chloroflexota bacterium]
MSHEAELPGEAVNYEQLQMICCRYFTAAKYASGKRLLEVGCGAGLGLGYLADIAAEVMGGDISEKNIRLARQHYGDRVKLLHLDAHKLPFPNSSYDIIISMEVIQYLDLPVFLEECRRVLKKGGALLLCIPNRNAPGFHPSYLSARYWSVPELAGQMAERGFPAELYGAFPIRRTSTLEDLRGHLIIMMSRLLGSLPGGKAVKAWLNRRVIGRTILLKPEITAADIDSSFMELQPLEVTRIDKTYRLIYAINKSSDSDGTGETQSP